MTPTAEIAIPNHCRVLRASRPISHAIKAATTGMRAENMLDFATPRVLIVPTQRVNARLEQSTARQRIGCHTSSEKYSVNVKLSRPFQMKNGRRNTDPMRNWYITIIWLEYVPERLLVSDAWPTSLITAISSRIIPHMKFSPMSPFDMATMTIPISDMKMPLILIALIFSLKNIMPAPTEKIGMVAMTMALMVGEPVALSPYVSQMK